MSNAETMQNCAQMDNMKCRTKIRKEKKNKIKIEQQIGRECDRKKVIANASSD